MMNVTVSEHPKPVKISHANRLLEHKVERIISALSPGTCCPTAGHEQAYVLHILTYVDAGLMGSSIVCTCGWITFRTSILCPYSELMACSSETSVSTCKCTRRYYPEDQLAHIYVCKNHK